MKHAQACLTKTFYRAPVSKPSRPVKIVKSGVSSNDFIILSSTGETSLGGGPPPVWFSCLRMSEKRFLAELVRFFHFSFTS